MMAQQPSYVHRNVQKGNNSYHDFIFRHHRTKVATDPTTLQAVVKDPSNVEETYVYGVDAEWVKNSHANYTLTVAHDAVGTWTITTTTGGTIAQTIVGTIIVIDAAA